MESERRDNSTRDLAVEARSLIQQHMTDCTKFRESLTTMLSEMRTDSKDMKTDIKTLNNRMLLIIGGLIVISKIMDFGVTYLHK